MKRNKDRNYFRFSHNGNFYTNCLNNTYYFIVDKHGNPDLASAKEQFPCLVFDDDPDHQDSVFLNQYDGSDKGQQTIAEFFVLCNSDDLLDRPGRDLADEIEFWFQQPARFPNNVEYWLQAKSEFPNDVEAWLHRELRNKQEEKIQKLQEECKKKFQTEDQITVDKISLNTYLNNMFK